MGKQPYIRTRIAVGIAATAIMTILLLTGRQDVGMRIPRRSSVFQEGRVEAEGGIRRSLREWKMMRDPTTGRIPEGIRALEMRWVRDMPVRGDLSQGGSTLTGTAVANTYVPVGPSLYGGRTRGFAFDTRFNGTTNRIMLAGGINGGIFRSVNGGLSWTFVHPANEVRSLSCLAQDPRPGFQDTWYAGTGESDGVSAAGIGSFVSGNGIFKSTDNGLTWSKLASTADDNPSSLNFFDLVTRIAVHPVTGHVYAAIQQRIVRSTDGGATWSTLLGSPTSTSNFRGQTDVMINKTGSRLFAAFSGRNPDRAFAGVWTSTTGNAGDWARMAGGLNGQTDSIPGWRAYNNTTLDADGEFGAGWGRIAFGLAPSNQDIMYVLVMNALSAAAGNAEADLFRCDMGGFPAFNWTNVSAGLTAKAQDGTTVDDTWYEGQYGYDMAVAVHPTQPNIVFLGGVNLYRSTNGFSTAANSTFIGGYSSDTYDDPDFLSHPDIHQIGFDPSNPNRMVVASDGGLIFTDNASAPRVLWANLNNQYQTFQYYHVGIDPVPGTRNFYGGAQDNGTSFRDVSGMLAGVLPDSNDHYLLIGGDGGQVGMSSKNAQGRQFLYGGYQNGNIYRVKLFPPFDNSFYTYIKPANAGDGEFVTYFHLDEDNTENLYFVSMDTIFRTSAASTVTRNTGWTALTGAAGFIDGSIYAMATTRGSYKTSNHLFAGTDAGKVYRFRDPANFSAGAIPDDITPPGMTAGSVVSDIAVNPRNHDTLLVVASNYNIPSIFWTGNATATNPTWQVVEGNLTIPSVRSCAVVATGLRVEYYVGTTAGLFSAVSMNGASTVWSRETGGAMNTAIVNSLAYRWQDNTLLVGTHGNGMFASYIGNAVNLPTAVVEPVRNDPNFIRSVYPNPTRGMVFYSVGNMARLQKLDIRVTNLSGQVVLQRSVNYRDGALDMGRLPAGNYILTLTSPDRRWQHTRQIRKE